MGTLNAITSEGKDNACLTKELLPLADALAFRSVGE